MPMPGTRSSSSNPIRSPMPEREPVTVVDYLNLAVDFLAKRGIENPRLHAELLLGDVVGLKRIELYLQFDRPLTTTEIHRYRELLRRRSTGEPVQYILGHTEFYGRRFAVNPSVLIPRPETEVLVEQTLNRLRGVAEPDILDIGTGSGAIAVTIAAERPDARVVATDISADALDTARANAE
ncbi:MAG TPA: peptide chain release factor N(5)-glutamine methyltransferase, partial [Firmicutes bacterium]|nr:peptide chain release factor N(5)-glutamine methyltransferase [Bacillota bacterium]